MALDYGCCGHKNLGIQLPPATNLSTLTLMFTLPESPILPCFILFQLGTLPGRDCSILWYLDRVPTKWWMALVKIFACISSTWYNCMQSYQISLKELVCLCRAAAWKDACPVWQLDQPGAVSRLPITAMVAWIHHFWFLPKYLCTALQGALCLHTDAFIGLFVMIAQGCLPNFGYLEGRHQV